jgi:hypothetical protein
MHRVLSSRWPRTARDILLILFLSAHFLVADSADASDFSPAGNSRPNYVGALESIYGIPNQEGFGSTVLFSTAMNEEEWEKQSLKAYQFFVGELWERWGEAAWMGSWRLVYMRGQTGDILEELRQLPDQQARSSAEMILDGGEIPENAKKALVETFNDPLVSSLLIFNIGDGEQLSGLLVAARRRNDEATYLVFLMD